MLNLGSNNLTSQLPTDLGSMGALTKLQVGLFSLLKIFLSHAWITGIVRPEASLVVLPYTILMDGVQKVHVGTTSDVIASPRHIKCRLVHNSRQWMIQSPSLD